MRHPTLALIMRVLWRLLDWSGQTANADARQVRAWLDQHDGQGPTPEVDRVNCAICGLSYTPGEAVKCRGDKHNLGLLTPEALAFSGCAHPRAKRSDQ